MRALEVTVEEGDKWKNMASLWFDEGPESQVDRSVQAPGYEKLVFGILVFRMFVFPFFISAIYSFYSQPPLNPKWPITSPVYSVAIMERVTCHSAVRGLGNIKDEHNGIFVDRTGLGKATRGRGSSPSGPGASSQH